MTTAGSLLAALSRAAATERGIRFIGGSPARLTYAELATAASRKGSALAARYAVGRPILLVMPNGPELVTTFFGALHAGLVPAILSLPRPFGDLDHYVRNLVRVSAHADRAPIVGPSYLAALLSKPPAGHLEVLDPATLEAAEPAPARPHALALLQFTSGSLGDPKGVMLTHDAVLGDGEAIAAALEATPDDVGCYWVPLAHDMGLIGSLVFLLSLGAEQVLMSVEQFAVDPGQWLRVAAERGATLLSGPPFAFDLAQRRLAKDALRGVPPPDLARVRGCVVGAEPVSARVLRKVSTALAGTGFRADPWVAAYGLAEYACVATMGRGLRTLTVRPGNVLGDEVAFAPDGVELVSNGRPIPGARVRVVDAAGAPLGEGRFGRVEVAGRSATQGYWRDPEATAATLHDGWVRTGDIGFIASGDLFISGREKDVIIVRGRHVFPEEIESTIVELPGVRSGGVVAFGVVDPSGGPERVTVVIEAGTEVDFAALERQVREHVADRLDLALAAVVRTSPRSLPRTTSGKVRRGEARARWGGETAG